MPALCTTSLLPSPTSSRSSPTSCCFSCRHLQTQPAGVWHGTSSRGSAASCRSRTWQLSRQIVAHRPRPRPTRGHRLARQRSAHSGLQPCPSRRLVGCPPERTVHRASGSREWLASPGRSRLRSRQSHHRTRARARRSKVARANLRCGHRRRTVYRPPHRPRGPWSSPLSSTPAPTARRAVATAAAANVMAVAATTQAAERRRRRRRARSMAHSHPKWRRPTTSRVSGRRPPHRAGCQPPDGLGRHRPALTPLPRWTRSSTWASKSPRVMIRGSHNACRLLAACIQGTHKSVHGVWRRG